MHKNFEQKLNYLNQYDYSPILFSFMAKFKFNKKNVDCINNNGVTPLTLSIELNQQDITLELLLLKANPLIENIHGNTPLILSLNKPFYTEIIQQAIQYRTYQVLDCDVNKYFYYNNKKFIIKRILQEGSCSLLAFELQDCNTLEKYFAKIKTNFGGLEIRNYISLNQYIDLLIINKLNIYNQKQNIDKTFKNVYCMIQKFASGKMLSIVLNSLQNLAVKHKIMVAAITALSNLHNEGYIHNDALPNNCFWDQETETATFIDYDVMRTYTDILSSQGDEYLEKAKYLDFERLIRGDQITSNQNNLITYGLAHYIENIDPIVEDIDNTILSPKFKKKLLFCE